MRPRGTSDIAAHLAALARAPEGFQRPRHFSLGCDAQAAELHALVQNTRGLVVRDLLTIQIAELLHSRAAREKRDARNDAEVARTFLSDRGGDAYGVWVYLPWRNTLTRLLSEPDFLELRSARNQLHLTPREQQTLREKRVGIVGLSVGYSMAITLALEGVGGSFRLADFDHLELSNTNRVSSGITALGHNKAVLAARAMFEIDPFLDIQVYEDGIRAHNYREFFSAGGTLDVLVEECDDLPMKLRLREHARELQVPVVTETSQRGLLDIERYDREPTRPAFHGLMGDIDADRLGALSTREKAPFLLRFLEGADGMSTSLAASLVEVERSLAGWPQLASSVTLGGAVVTDATRRILLGTLQRSGRFRVDMGAIVSDEAAAAWREPATPAAATEPPKATPPPDSTWDAGLARWVRWACMAPSGGNVQPWHFREDAAGQLSCWLSERGADSALDPERTAARVACAAAFTNLELAARQDGYRTEVSWQPDPGRPELLYRCHFTRDAAVPPDALAAMVPLRCTNRRQQPRTELPSEVLQALEAEALAHGAELVIRTSREALEEAGRVLGGLERARVFSASLYREMMQELVDAPGAPLGISLETLECEPADLAALAILRRRDVVELLRSEGRGDALTELAAKPVREAAAVCMLHVPGEGPRAYLKGGIALQRVWLRATACQVALQPVSAGLYMLAQLRNGNATLCAQEREALEPWVEPFQSCFPVPPGRTGILTFRLTNAPPPSARSARLPLDAVFTRAARSEPDDTVSRSVQD